MRLAGEALPLRLRDDLVQLPEHLDDRDPATAARTRFRPAPWSLLDAGAAAPEGWTLLECEPVTGRTHQIRATLRGLGLEVAGDKLYGPDRAIYGRLCEGRMTDADLAALVLPRQALHAWKLAFRDPFANEEVEAVAPPTLPLPPAGGGGSLEG